MPSILNSEHVTSLDEEHRLIEPSFQMVRLDDLQKSYFNLVQKILWWCHKGETLKP